MSKADQKSAFQSGQRIVVMDRAQIMRGLDALKAKLSLAREAFDGRIKSGKPDRLVATCMALNGLYDLLLELDPDDTDGYRAVVLESIRGLNDLREGNQIPDWLQPQRKWDRPQDASEKWARRTSAAIVLDWMLACGVPKNTALAGIAEVLEQHGLGVGKPTRIYGWRRQCRDGDVPEANLRHFRRQTARPQQYASPEEALAQLKRFLAEDLTHRGHPMIGAKKTL